MVILLGFAISLVILELFLALITSAKIPIPARYRVDVFGWHLLRFTIISSALILLVMDRPTWALLFAAGYFLGGRAINRRIVETVKAGQDAQVSTDSES